MEVVNLGKYRSREVVAALEELLEWARAGDIRGLAYVINVTPGDSRAGTAGVYRKHPEQALQATFQLERMLREPLQELG